MAYATERTTGNRQQITDYDLSKFLKGNNEFVTHNLTASGADVTIKQAMVMGRVSASGLLVPLLHTATDGSQYPAGLAYVGMDQEIVVADGDTKAVELVNKGKVDKAFINFGTASTLDSVVGGQRIDSLLENLGLTLLDINDVSAFDN